MSIRNVVKVMNFHSLIRVDKAKRQADKYLMMEDQLYAMMEAIVNNRNLILDKKIFKVNEDAPKINIYIGSDFGFCSNYNSQVNDQRTGSGRGCKDPDRKEITFRRSRECLGSDPLRPSGRGSRKDPEIP